jgi:TRAP-type uncharacterized transport system substrate-binding protein
LLKFRGRRRSHRLAAALTILIAVPFLYATTSYAQSPDASGPLVVAQNSEQTTRKTRVGLTAASTGESGNVARINNWTVGLAGGLLEGTFIRFAAEIAKALDDGDNLRVLPIVTYGATENVSDLLYLKGVDISMTHADVFEEFKRAKKVSNVDKRIHYISQLYIGELHVYARPEIKTIKDLEGKKVGFHTKGAGPTVTGPILFERLGVTVEPVFINNSIALEKMRTGEIAAVIHTVGKPNDLFAKFKPEPGFHFLPVEFTDKFADYYVPSTLGHEDYPNLFKPGEKVETIGVPVVLAVYNWPSESDRFRRVQRFVEYYFGRFATLQKPPFHPKWREINLAAKVPGWTRYWVADELLKRAATAQTTSSGTTAAIDPAVARQQAARAAPGNTAEQERLFQQFLEWSRKQPKQ